MAIYAALGKVERVMDLAGVRYSTVGGRRVAHTVHVRVVPGGVTAETDVDLGVWVREGYVMELPPVVAVAVPEPIPEPEPVSEPEVAPEPVAVVAEPIAEPIVEPKGEARVRGRFTRRAS